MTWLPRWIAALDSIWFSLKRRFGPQTVPDCLFFFWNENAFMPASYSQTLCQLRSYMVKSGIPAAQARCYSGEQSIVASVRSGPNTVEGNDDAADFLTREAKDEDLRVDPFMDSDGDEPGTQQSASEAPQPKGWPKAAAPPSQECGSFRFLVRGSSLVEAFEALPLDEKLKVLRSMDARGRQQTAETNTPAPAVAHQGSAGSSGPTIPTPPVDPMGEHIASEEYNEPTLPASGATAAQPTSRPMPEVAKAANRGQKPPPDVKTPPARSTAAPANNPTAAKANPPPGHIPPTATPAASTPRPFQIAPLLIIPGIGAEIASEQKGARPNRPQLTAPKLGNTAAGKSSPLGAGMNSGAAPGMRAGIRANGANESRLRDGIAPLLGDKARRFVSPLGLSTRRNLPGTRPPSAYVIHSIMSDFNQMITESAIPPAVATLLGAFNRALFARACASQAELDELINEFTNTASISAPAELSFSDRFINTRRLDNSIAVWAPSFAVLILARELAGKVEPREYFCTTQTLRG
ncbi:unnamed protein product [Symbiodinium necroappetens]|uniref:Uncharacterized protein n=1 Tax=Symbiodinium necroappetens TaxID=1628268 RepID=A0A812ZWA3_9DINO|nr:unnamed protein product [Symbiodinium necroappetens]